MNADLDPNAEPSLEGMLLSMVSNLAGRLAGMISDEKEPKASQVPHGPAEDELRRCLALARSIEKHAAEVLR
jgi:hypothetical protein